MIHVCVCVSIVTICCQTCCELKEVQYCFVYHLRMWGIPSLNCVSLVSAATKFGLLCELYTRNKKEMNKKEKHEVLEYMRGRYKLIGLAKIIIECVWHHHYVMVNFAQSCCVRGPAQWADRTSTREVQLSLWWAENGDCHLHHSWGENHFTISYHVNKVNPAMLYHP